MTELLTQSPKDWLRIVDTELLLKQATPQLAPVGKSGDLIIPSPKRFWAGPLVFTM